MRNLAVSLPGCSRASPRQMRTLGDTLMTFIQNLRIGTKLAVTSALTIVLVALMIFLQTSGDANVQKLSNAASGQQAIAQNAAEAKASVRGMQIGIRDILMSASPA